MLLYLSPKHLMKDSPEVLKILTVEGRDQAIQQSLVPRNKTLISWRHRLGKRTINLIWILLILFIVVCVSILIISLFDPIISLGAFYFGTSPLYKTIVTSLALIIYVLMFISAPLGMTFPTILINVILRKGLLVKQLY
jgi:hypothetical protein